MQQHFMEVINRDVSPIENKLTKRESHIQEEYVKVGEYF